MRTRWLYSVAVAILVCGMIAGCGKAETAGQPTTTESKAAVAKSTVPMAVPKGVPVLMYHMIGPDKDNGAVLSEENFRAQMKLLKDEGFHTISLTELYDYMVNNIELPVKPVVLTFDDGYKDTRTIVAPLLKEYGFKGTAFIPTEEVGKRLTWGEIKEMKELGMDIYSHSYHHKALTEVGNFNAQLQEIKKSQQDLKDQLGIINDMYCYPYGAHNSDSVKALQESGIKAAVTMDPGWANYGKNPLLIQRVWIGNPVDINNFRQRVTTEQYESR